MMKKKEGHKGVEQANFKNSKRSKHEPKSSASRRRPPEETARRLRARKKTTPGNACQKSGIDAPETEEAGEIGDERRDDNEREYAHLRFGATPKPAGYFLKTETSH